MTEPISIPFLIFFICFIGYKRIKLDPRDEVEYLQTDNYHTLFLVANKGVDVLFRSFLVYIIGGFLLHKITDGCTLSLSHLVIDDVLHISSESYVAAISDIYMIGLIFVYVLIPYHQNRANYEVSFRDWAYYSSNPSEFVSLIWDSYKYGLPILFTLSDGKVFLGYPLEAKVGEIKDISILPLYSGFRTKKQTLRLVTPYCALINYLSNTSSEQVEMEKFNVTLAIREIVHAQLYNFEYQEAFWAIENNHTHKCYSTENPTSSAPTKLPHQ